MSRIANAAVALLTILILQVSVTSVSGAVCSGSDCVIYDFSTQSQCIEVASEGPTRDCRWFAGMGAFTDQVAKGGRIFAYQIQWFNGRWSGWYAPGVNDIDWKFNPSAIHCTVPSANNGLRRVWSYFYDHNHRYIICKSP